MKGQGVASGQGKEQQGQHDELVDKHANGHHHHEHAQLAEALRHVVHAGDGFGDEAGHTQGGRPVKERVCRH